MTSTFPTNVADNELARLIATYPWHRTPLGPLDTWPSTIRSTVSLILNSNVPMVTLWGEAGVMVYNDAYAQFAGARHPELLGTNVREGWKEVADFNDNVMRVGLAGRTLSYRQQELTLHRKGYPQQVLLDLDYSPVLDEAGIPIGVLAIVHEVTERVEAERWRSSERERLRYMFENAPGFIAMLYGPEHVFDLVNQAYLNLVGNRDVLGKTAREAYPDLVGQGFFELLDRVYASGEAHVGTAVPIVFKNGTEGESRERFIDLVYQPIRDPDDRIVGVFAQGSDVTDRVMAEKALRASEEHSRQIIDSAVDYAIIALDLDGCIVRWNDGARLTFGWTADEVVGSHWEMLFNPQDKAAGKADEAIRAALENGSAHHDRWHVRKDGRRFWASGEIRPLLDNSGTAIGFVKILRDRTQEHLADQALIDAQARLRRAQVAGGVGVFALDLTSNVLAPTPEFCKIYGLDVVDTIPIDMIQALVVDDDQSVASNPETRRSGTAPLNVEYRIRRADTGEKRFIARRGEFEYDDQGVPVRFVGVVQDVTERRRSQRALRESEARFRALTQAMPNHVWTAGPDGKLDWFNSRVYEYSGHSEGELNGDAWVGMVHPEDLEPAVEKWTSSLSTGNPYETEFRLRDRNGAYRWHIARGIPIKDETGAVVLWIGTNTDIEEQRATLEHVSELNETLEQRVAERTADRDRMWRLSTDIMLVADFQANILSINPAWTSLLGWLPEELLNTSFTRLIHPDDLRATLDEVAKLGSGATTFAFVNRYQCRDGSYRTISWTAVPDDSYIHAVGRDVTQEQEAATALRKTELALQQAQKMEAIGNLTGGVAHDFNNLLQVVAGNLQLLGKDIVGNERAQKRVSNALEGVNRGSKLASQLLAFGRRQALDPRVLNVGRLVRGMDDMLRRTIGEGIEVETVVSGGLWNTLVDPMQIENALLNLAINARDAMEGYGRLTIEVGNAFLDDAYALRHDEVEAGQYVVVSVTDTGSGMGAEVMEKVFEPFFSTKPEGKGTGLGLSMVYGFVKQSGGHVKLYSEIGQGTTVRMYLPRSTQLEDLRLEQANIPVEGGHETVLVAEDDEGVRSTVVEMLQELGYRVLKAPDAAAALSIIESGVAIDLLFTDVVMPGPLKSADLARKAKDRIRDIGVLFTSGYTENSIVHGGRLDAGVQLLSKPYSREQLARKIRQVLDDRRQPEPPTMGSPIRRQPEADATHRLRILLVEDEVLIRMSTADILIEKDHHVAEASSAEEALLLLEGQQFDVMITDLGLPDMSGEELCARVRATWPDVAIIFATGSSVPPPLGDVSRTAFLVKPYGLDALEEALRAVVQI
ncbi:histidine kinase [Rhizobium sp. Leaf384]|uniref:hybrid sensor histidine kinase/response regulator n=1 Tax=Rhizobium sp. Leaf384 TaxID=1736358 RepID=UPI0007151C8F|nr:PAS domain S-box protein [Rhizobium sp. Leaf384]KQS75185.1 histidine kinase [Rhizobium sp. Leaf384]